VILGFVLGPIMERNLDLSLQVLGWQWYNRPWVMVIFCIIVAVLGSIAWRSVSGRRTNAKKAALNSVETEVLAEVEAEEAAEEAGPHPALVLLLGGLFLASFAACWWLAQGWTADARFFPTVVSVAGVAFSLMVVVSA